MAQSFGLWLASGMTQRMQLGSVDPAAYAALRGLEKYLSESPLEARHKHLIKLRASQINGCSYCVDLHVRDALRDGDTHDRLHLVALWREVPHFDARERAILALVEEVTLLTNGVSDATWDNAERELGAPYLAATLMAIITINAWNRVGVPTRMAPALPAPAVPTP
jgi:AhpD family alkylhydroperoxidase